MNVVDTDCSAAEASVNAGSALLAAAAAAVVLADTSVEKDAHVAATPWIGLVVVKIADLTVEASAGPDAAASFGTFHVEMGIAEAVVVNHVAEVDD